MWVSADGMGTSWQRYSISYWHNRLVQNASDRFTSAVNSTDAKHPSASGAETTGYTTVLWLGASTGVITYDRALTVAQEAEDGHPPAPLTAQGENYTCVHRAGGGFCRKHHLGNVSKAKCDEQCGIPSPSPRPASRMAYVMRFHF